MKHHLIFCFLLFSAAAWAQGIDTKSSQRDVNYEKFRQAFLAKPLGFEEAAKIILKATGIRTEKRTFMLADRRGITKTKRFYEFCMLPFIFPSSFADIFGDQRLTMETNHVFDTYVFNPQDARVHVLASYIIVSQKCETPEEAARAICAWVINNVPVDLKNLSVPYMSPGEEKKYGYGVTNNHANSIAILNSSGVCVDYCNIAMDLLNSVGIPARVMLVMAHGILTRDLETATRIEQALKSIEHSIIEVNLSAGTKFFNVTPMHLAGTQTMNFNLLEISDPADYIQGRLERRYDDIKTFRLVCFRAMPQEAFVSYPALKKALDQDIFKTYEASTIIVKNQKISKMLYTTGSDYNYYVWDAFFNDLMKNPANYKPRK